MAKLPTDYPGSGNHTDIIQLLHDEVVSLCQKNYNTVSGLEIDGIICISILDTKEQKVVKIHKTLKSVFADKKKKPKKQKIHDQPSCWLGGNTGFLEEVKDSNSANFQNDINALSNLLRDTNAAINRELTEKSSEESAPKQSKRKRKCPKQRVTNNAKVADEINESSDTSQTNVSRAQVLEENYVENIPGINPFIHKDVLKVKEEKIDPEYESAEQTSLKIVNVSSVVTENDKNKTEPNENVVEQTKVSSIIDRLIDREIPKKDVEISKKSEERDNVDKQIKDEENRICNGDEFQAVEVKVEKIVDESEYGGVQYDSEEVAGATSDNAGTGGSNSEAENYECPREWLYNEHSSLGELGRTALLDKLQEKGSIALKGYPREVGRVEPDPLGRSWIEMVKDNVNKYQAALERSGKVRSDVDNDHKVTSSGTVQTSQLAKSSSSLVALLKQPAASVARPKDIASNVSLDNQRNYRGSSVPLQGTNPIPGRGTSVSPIIKIEVDEDMSPEIYSQSDSEINGDNKNKNPMVENHHDSKSVTTKAPQGKLESRYPALFSHLQQAKQLNADNQDQSDSLLNRLPFISFQELFSQASAGKPASGLSESTTMQLLAQARLNPHPSKEKHKVQRKVWNWKKRQVRPKDGDGNIISPLPINMKSQQKKHGFHASFKKKTFSKRGSKSEKEIDSDWQPEVDNIDVDSDNNDNIPNTSDTEYSLGRRTRLSCGEKPRINFAELENSDIEMEEEDMDMTPTSSWKQFTGNENQRVFTEKQGEITSIFPGGSSEQLLAAFSARSEQLNIANNSAAEQFKCSLCGLEFNQEYRWHYHLIKVHGITADKVKLFR